MFDPNQAQMCWARPCIGGPVCGEFRTVGFTSVPPAGYVSTNWFAIDGVPLGEIYQHESIKTPQDFERAVEQWFVIRNDA